MDLYSTVYQFNKWYVVRLQEICSKFQTTPVQWLVMYHIAFHEGCTSKDIVNVWSVEKPTVAYYVRKLSEQGLLQSVIGRDKREKYLSLTPEGEELCSKINVKVKELQTFVTKPFTEEEIATWTEQVEILGERMKAFKDN